jgi:putative protein-disulfide isomerase
MPTGNKEMVYGSKPYSTFESCFVKLIPSATKTTYDKTWNAVLLNIIH